MKLNHILSTKQFLNQEFLAEIFDLATELEIQDQQKTVPAFLHNKIIATVFYEPSTRTRFSFETAVYKLGGQVISTENAAQFSSSIKGESLSDTIKIINGYADCIVLRHFQENAADIAAKVSTVPIINAGDGVGEHPTQALLDLYTMKKELGQIDELKIALVGDLLNGRTIHSLVHLLSLYKVKIYLVSPEQLKLPDQYKDYFRKHNIETKEVFSLDEIVSEVDVLYMTRVQKERFDSLAEYEKLKDAYVVNEETLNKLKDRSIIMHPLPRVGEITPAVDNDSRAAYFRQAKNGLYVRMALLKLLFGK